MAQRNGGFVYQQECLLRTHSNYSSDLYDKVRIDILRQFFNGLTYATLNYYTFNDVTSRFQALQWRASRPVLAMQGPWVIGGNINDGNAAANDWINAIDTMSGMSTDGPEGLWAANTGSYQPAEVSAIQYTRAKSKQVMVMLASYSSGSDANFLTDSENHVRYLEDNNAVPDVYAISYYASDLEHHAVVPEANSDGSPNPSITGVAYWLLKHLKGDPCTLNLYAKRDDDGAMIGKGEFWTRSPDFCSDRGGDQSGSNTGEKMVRIPARVPSGTMFHYQLKLANTSSWLDYAPILQASESGTTSAWKVHCKLGGLDITGSVLGGGYKFYQDRRLDPESTEAVDL